VNKEKLAKKLLTPLLSGVIKIALAYPRFLIQLNVCKQGFMEFGTRYKQQVLFVAGLPKSGTTWLENMLFSLTGFHEIMIPEAVYYEQKHIGSHNYDIPSNTFSRLNGTLSVLKLHIHGSLHNQKILKQSDLNYIVLFRDLRDVAVSYYFYVRNTPWHPEYKTYKNMSSIQQGLIHFGNTLLTEYQDWVSSWRSCADPQCLIIKYEDLKLDTFNQMQKIISHYKLNLTTQEIQNTIDNNSFSNLSKGRSSGQDNSQSFFRKGVSGDWKNHFNDEVKTLYKDRIGDFLVREKYENDKNW
jgi:hypothetical protein